VTVFFGWQSISSKDYDTLSKLQVLRSKSTEFNRRINRAAQYTGIINLFSLESAVCKSTIMLKLCAVPKTYSAYLNMKTPPDGNAPFGGNFCKLINGLAPHLLNGWKFGEIKCSYQQLFKLLRQNKLIFIKETVTENSVAEGYMRKHALGSAGGRSIRYW